MSSLSECCSKYSISVQRIQYCSTYTLIYTKKNIYLFLENDSIRKKTFSLLKNIDYPFYRESINKDEDSYGLYLYHEDDECDDYKEKKMIQAFAYLHHKTMFAIHYSQQQSLELYRSIQKKIQDVLDYYNDLMDYIQSFSFPRIDYYCLIINISLIFHSIYQAFYYLDEWYQHYNIDSVLRKAFLIQDTSFHNFCCSKNSYFYNFSQCHEDLLIYDFVSFYRTNFDCCDMKKLFFEYQRILSYSVDELNLFFCIISIPNKVLFESSIYNNTIFLNNELNYIKKTEQFISEKDEEYQKTDE